MSDPYLFDEWFAAPGGDYWDTTGRLRTVDGFVQCRILNRNVTQLSEERFAVRMELSPVVRAATVVSASVLEADLEIGSAAFIGEMSDRHTHYASQVGAALPTLVVGKQYRLVATVIDNFNSPLNGYDNMDGASYGAYAGAASGTLVDAPGYTWTPGDGTSTVEGDYAGISFTYAPSHTPGAFGPGQEFHGDWLTFDGPPTVLDIGIGGSGISGFFGFHWRVHLELQER